jgi:hypothetical protein
MEIRGLKGIRFGKCEVGFILFTKLSKWRIISIKHLIKKIKGKSMGF